MGKLKINTDFKNLIPSLSEKEYQQLEENLLEEGCRDSLVVWNDTILDGHNRYEICTKHNIPFSTKEAMVDTKQEAIIWIIKNQFGRRNLQNATRVNLALKLRAVIQKEAKLNQEKARRHKKLVNQELGEPINTNKELGKIAGVSDETIRKYEVIQEKGTDEVKKAVDTAEMSIHKGFESTRDKKKKIQQIEKTNQTKLSNADISKMFYDMKKPSSATTDNGTNNDTIPTPIISELDRILKYIIGSLNKYSLMADIEPTTGTKVLIKTATNTLKTINENIKER